MEFVKLDGIYRGYLQTTDQAVFPETAAWPDDNIEAADVVAKILGVTYGGTKTVTQQTDVGLHLITIDCDGVAAGSVIELSGEYYIDSVRYAWSEQLFVGVNASSSEDAAKVRKFFTNLREPINGAATGYQRFRVYEDDGVTTAFDLDWKRSDGTIEPV